ncbi:hypothetical protein [Nonomuraea sp. NPDC046570]
MNAKAEWTSVPNGDRYRRLLALLFQPDEAEQAPDMDRAVA